MIRSGFSGEIDIRDNKSVLTEDVVELLPVGPVAYDIDDLDEYMGGIEIGHRDQIGPLYGELNRLFGGRPFRITGSFRVRDYNTVHGGAMSNFTGPDNLISIHGDIVVFSSESENMPVNGFQNLQKVDGSVYVSSLGRKETLQNIQSIGGNVSINGTLRNIDGLNKLQSIEGDLNISGNEYLETITGFKEIISINGGLKIDQNRSLKSISGFDKLAIAGSVSIVDNGNLSTDSLTAFTEKLRLNGYAGEIIVERNKL